MVYDLIIIGAGPAGLTAGIYAGRAKTNTLIIDKKSASGQIYNTSEVVNYPGILKISGPQLIETMKKQVQQFNVQITEDEIIRVDFSSNIKTLSSPTKTYQAHAIIVATGAMPRILNFENEKKFIGRGIGYCATCDGEFFEGLDIYVIGGGFAACEEALYLTRYGKTVTMLVRENEFLCAKSIIDKVNAHPKIKVLFNVEVTKAMGEDYLNTIEIIHIDTQKKEILGSKDQLPIGLFIFAGYVPETQVFKETLKLDQNGYIITNDTLQTNIKGVFVAGDLRVKSLRQIVTATSDGAIAAYQVEHYLNTILTHRQITSKQSQLINEDLSEQLAIIFKKLELPINFDLYFNDSPQSTKLIDYMTTITQLNHKLVLNFHESTEKDLPKFSFNNSSITWHGIPAGHELTPLIIAIHALSTQKIELDAKIIERIKKIKSTIHAMVGVTLNCTFCPNVVQNLMLISIVNPNIKIDIYDIHLFEEFKNQYRIMSVPALIINQSNVVFGNKKIDDIVNLIEKNDS